MKRILFVCTGNTCRSPMAQGLLTKILGTVPDENPNTFEICSAGLFAVSGLPASPEAIKTMQEYGIDISQHKSRQVNKEIIKQSDFIIVMTAMHYDHLLAMYPESENKLSSLGELAGFHGEVKDPFGKEIKEYKKTAAQLHSMLEKIIDKFI